ncbi:Glutathione S-transferase [Taenia solium]|eukprot:TsM_001220000 transcript=TsM_001220000 gene=TsM_001220000
MAPTLGYWDGKGVRTIPFLQQKAYGVRIGRNCRLGGNLGEQIRLLLAYLEVDFIDRRYKIGPVPECKKQRAVLHMLQCEIMDLRMPFMATFFGPDCQVGILDGAVVVLCVSSGRINYPDFALCDLLMQVTKSEPTYLQGYPKLQAYLWRFENLPELKGYLAAD